MIILCKNQFWKRDLSTMGNIKNSLNVASILDMILYLLYISQTLGISIFGDETARMMTLALKMA